MNGVVPLDLGRRIGRRARLVPYACIAAAVLVANSPALLHIVTVNPIDIFSDLATSVTPWRLHGYPTIDPNAGFLMQALGHLSTKDWLSGHVPWWNPYEGIGVPLAGDMQSGAFFLPTLLTGFSNGLLYMQIFLELVAGWCTFALLVRLGVGRTLAVSGGVAFGLCGTFAWFAIEPVRVMAFLPLCLLGVERVLSAAREERAWGWRLLAVGVAASIFGAFPETILLDFLFVAWWAVLRAAGPGRRYWWPMLKKLVSAVATGAALTAPLWVAFASYLRFADTGGLANGGFASVTLQTRNLAQLILPYSIGPIFGLHTAGPIDSIGLFWDNVGGYIDVTLMAGALVGLVGRRNRTLRVGLALWIVVCLGRTYGFAPFVHALALVPGVRLTAFYRYADPSWELAAVILTGMGLDDIARGHTRLRALSVGVVLTGAATAWAALTAWQSLGPTTGPNAAVQTHRLHFALGSLVVAVVTLAVLLFGGWWAGARPSVEVTDTRHSGVSRLRRARAGRVLLAAVVAFEAVALLGFTYLTAPRPTSTDTKVITWLQANLGTYRFATLGPIEPNYGSYFALAEVNVNELPLPRAWTRYVAKQLDPNTVDFEFTGSNQSNPAGPSAGQELSTFMANYEAVGVRYVVAPAGLPASTYPGTGASPWPVGPRLVYQDAQTEIWELPHAAPVFSLTGVGIGSAGPCRVAPHGWNEAQVTCDRPTTLIRRVQYIEGWSATAGSSQVAVRLDRAGPAGLFQEVSVPAGTTTVRFTYLPGHELPAVIVSALAAAGLLGSLVVTRRRRSRAVLLEDEPSAD